MKRRIDWIDIGKYICIMCVMISHLESRPNTLLRFFNPFFLTTFFFLSGYVYTQPDSFKEHFLKRVKGLFVPWFVFSNFNILLSGIISLKENRNPLTEMAWNALQIRTMGDGLWFVAALFVAFIPFYYVIRWNKPKQAIVLSVALSFISVIYCEFMNPALLPWGKVNLPWHLEFMFQAMLWMVLGYYFKIYAEATFDRFNTTANRILIWAGYTIIVFWRVPKDFWIYEPVSYIQSGVGICAVVAFCKVCKSNWYVRFVGANTLTYFALHGKVYAVIEAVLGKFSWYEQALTNKVASGAIAIAITIAMSVLLIIPAQIINQWFPWVLGRRKAVR